jgi:DNA-binding response OmpR family regulator
MNILLVEDNYNLALNIMEYLEANGNSVNYSTNGTSALDIALAHRFDIIILDIMLPGLDGFEFCKQLRASSHGDTPIIMFTAKDTEDYKVQGFNAGTDDYLVKPISLTELNLRIKAVVRRNKPEYFKNKHLTCDDLDYDSETRILKRGKEELSLNQMPLKILILLMRNPYRVVTREEIEREIWGDDIPDKEVLRSHIYAIRHEINKNGGPNILHTIRGVGYRLGGSDH